MNSLHDVKSYQFIGNKQNQRKLNLKGDLLLSRLKNLPSQKSILLDFDDTLFLKNSTELFINRVAAIYIFSIILQIFDLLKPWKIGAKKGDEISLRRDIFRLKFVLLFAPWSKKNWLKNASKIARDNINYPLMNQLLKMENPIYIVTFGYDFIVNPLVESLNLDWPIVVFSTTETILENRNSGKAKITEQQLGKEIWAKSICITDSALDYDILEKSSEPFLVKWHSEQIRAGLSPMLPFVYTKKIKRPTEKYFTHAIIGHDYLTLIIVFAVYNQNTLLTMLALFFFLLAYFSVYEIGYYENDKLGLSHEEKPNVSKEYHLYAHYFKSWHAWMFGVIFIR